MPKRRCAGTSCPVLVSEGTRFCPAHARQHEQARGTRQARGYGRDHDRLRSIWRSRLERGDTPLCPKCGQPVTAAQRWDLGHTRDRRAWTGPEHARCNRSDGGRRAHDATRNASR